MKIVCIGRNYVEHIEELGNEMPDEPLFFIKPQSAVSDRLLYRDGLHYEGEICFLIENKKISKVGFGLDLTLREVQSRLKAKGLPWERAKAFRGSAVLSDFVPIENWQGLELRVYKNGALVQKGDTSLMIYKPDTLLQEADEVFGLQDGDILMSGTPKGVGPIERGDKFRGEIWQDGRLLVAKEWSAG
ncbi:MAG: 2-keto-4-pentenoate hydratase [Epsilonproteobacteria bacterium]|nr:2-keto-4-pentenoate hydratase [Campylobacterota bacterium]NPA63408.1 fumarylacetoacetate hydrolase family protein [Campylobacterota bacterium]